MRAPICARLRSIALLVTLPGLLAGCATPPPASEPAARQAFQQQNDPWEPFNRSMYRVNDKLDQYVLRPAAVAYTDVFPQIVRDGIHNALTNLATPIVLGNDMLQSKPQRAGTTLMRFVINTTIGGLGFVDVAKRLGYPSHDSDFGITLALWGSPPGPYLFLPLLGPGDPRDHSGRLVDIVGDPLTWVGQGAVVRAVGGGRFVLNVVDQRSQVLGTISSIKETALDPYATFRSLFRQHREAQISEVRAANARTIPAWFPQPDNTQPAQ